MLKKVREITIVLALLLLISGCGEERENSRSGAVSSETAETSASETLLPRMSTISTFTRITAMLTETETETQLQTETQSEVQTETQAAESSEPEVNAEFENFKENVVVIGDSIALGYGSYDRLPIKNVYAKQSASPSKLDDFKFDYKGGEALAITILNDLQPKYIMLSMGLNDITTYSPENFAEKYTAFVDEVLKNCPDSEIYIMGLTPVQSNCEYTTNQKIDDYNSKLSEIFDSYDKDVHFVNSGTVLKKDDGSLDMEYSSGDGIHITGAAYDKLLENLEKYLYE